MGLSQQRLAEKSGVTQGLIGQIESGLNKGSKHVISIAAALGVRPEWLASGAGEVGRSPGEENQHVEPSTTAVSADESDTFVLHQYEAGGRMGNGGLELRDQPGIIESWRVSREWLEKNVRDHTTPDNLCIVTGFGDSMKPMFNPGDPLILDVGVKVVDFDAVYFFRVENEGFIKRLQRIPGKGLTAISENNSYRDWVIDGTMDFEVFGRILKVWRSEDV